MKRHSSDSAIAAASPLSVLSLRDCSLLAAIEAERVARFSLAAAISVIWLVDGDEIY